MKLRCTFAPSTVLNTAIQKTSSSLSVLFLLSPVSFLLFVTPTVGVGKSRCFQLCGNNKRDKKEDTRSFYFPISEEGSRRREHYDCNFLSPLSVNNVYFPPVISFFFLREERLCPGNLITRQIGAHECVRTVFPRPSVFLFNESRENLCVMKFHGLQRMSNEN